MEKKKAGKGWIKVKENLHLRQLVGSFLPHSSKEGEAVDEEDEQDNWREEDTEEMLVMMENALVKAEDDDERINVVQEIGSVMQVLTEVTLEVGSLGEEVGAAVPLPEGEEVGRLLETAEEGGKWRGLVTKLSIKKRKSMRRRGSLAPTVAPNMARRGSLFCAPPKPDSDEEDDSAMKESLVGEEGLPSILKQAVDRMRQSEITAEQWDEPEED